jgi:BirA family biotin operon repressor/biotin-[acetyl-CoA-carboxylase] ligase
MDFKIEELQELFVGRRLIGCHLDYREEMESTNSEALRLAQEGAPEGTVVITDSQLKGRGRLDRTWESPPAANLYLSVILRPDLPAASASLIPLTAGVAVADAVSVYCRDGVRLKWPNDVLVEGKKISGILTEMRTRGDRVAFVIVGIGVNINMRPHLFPPELRPTATSLRIETGTDIDRVDFTVRLLESLERMYRIFLNAGEDHIRDRWLQYADIVGRRIEVIFKEDVQRGVVIGLDNSGALLLEGDAGVQQVVAGDVYIERL